MQVLTAIGDLHLGSRLRGIVLELRSGGGGAPAGVSQLLGAFAYGKTWGYDVDGNGTRTANHTDDAVPLLNQPLVVLAGPYCDSACDAFADAVKDLHAGTLVGTRTAGQVSGQSAGYPLDDGSALGLPGTHWLGADSEIVDGVGVAPDVYAPVTPQSLSSGHDPGIEEALALLQH